MVIGELVIGASKWRRETHSILREKRVELGFSSRWVSAGASAMFFYISLNVIAPYLFGQNTPTNIFLNDAPDIPNPTRREIQEI